MTKATRRLQHIEALDKPERTSADEYPDYRVRWHWDEYNRLWYCERTGISLGDLGYTWDDGNDQSS